MQIGIIEICEPNHYTAVTALAETYAVDKDNQIVIYTLKNIAPLFTGLRKNISLKIKRDDQNIASFLNEAASAGMDRIHINTLSKYYTEFAAVSWQGCIWFTVHNVDNFFANKQLHRLRLLFFEWGKAIKDKAYMGIKDAFAQYIKDFSRQSARNKFITKLLRTPHKIIVYSHSQKNFLQQFVNPKDIVIFPFCLHEEMTDASAVNKRLRICVPGSVTSRRRDYNSLIAMLNKYLPFFRDNVTVDVLGYIPQNERHLADEFLKLSKLGVDIIYNLDFVDTVDFDTRLSKADVILGNLVVQLDPYRRYGETKETGVIFNVIKAGKPAMLPAGYPVDDELQDICLFYKNYDELYQQITGLVNNNNSLQQLKQRANTKAKNYTPQKLYHLLAN
jgi:hypothetical protein